MGKFYITYEEPFHDGKFTLDQMKEIYSDMVDKAEYPEFQIWLDDMIKSGVFEEV